MIARPDDSSRRGLKRSTRLPMIGEATAMAICTSARAFEIWLLDHPSSFSIEVMTRLRDERAEKETASTRKQKPTMIQAPRSCCCREEAVELMECLCQGRAEAIILAGAACGHAANAGAGM